MGCAKCSDEDNRLLASKDQINYYVIEVKVLDHLPQNQIKFSAPGSGEPHVAFWGDPAVMWAACPSTLSLPATGPGQPGPRPGIGKKGILHLSRKYVMAENAAARPITIPQDPKWPRPDPLDEPTYHKLTMVATKLVLTGFETMTDFFGSTTFDLMDVNLGGPNQTIEFNGRNDEITVQVSDAVLTKMGVSDPFARVAQARKIIENEAATAAERAWAWGVVARSERALAAGKNATSIAKDDRAWLRSVLRE